MMDCPGIYGFELAEYPATLVFPLSACPIQTKQEKAGMPLFFGVVLPENTTADVVSRPV